MTLDYDTPSEMLPAQNSPNSSAEWNSAGLGESWLGSQNQFVPVIDTRASMSAKLPHAICALIVINRYLRYAQEMRRLITFTQETGQNIATQSLLMWVWKLVDELLEYRLCTDKLLNFHWTCRLRKGSFSKRKIHQTTNNFSFTYLSEMFDLVRK